MQTQAKETRRRVVSSEHTMKRPSMQIGLGIALGIGIGAGVAIILGSGGLWLAVGIAVGIAIGAAMSRHKWHPELSQANDQRLTTND
jgi:hypothetical protein